MFRPLLFLHYKVICCWANDPSEKCHAVIVLTPQSIKTRVTRLSQDYFHIVIWLSYVNAQKLCLVWGRHCQIADLVKDTQQRTIFSVPLRNCDLTKGTWREPSIHLPVTSAFLNVTQQQSFSVDNFKTVVNFHSELFTILPRLIRYSAVQCFVWLSKRLRPCIYFPSLVPTTAALRPHTVWAV